MRIAVFVALALVAVPLVGATGSFGTEANPELVDMADDVSYDDAHVGAQDHDYLDLVSAWFEYDNRTDVVVATIKVADATALSSPPTDYLIHCYVRGNVVADGQTMGELTYRAMKPSGETAFESEVEFEEDPDQNIQGFDSNEQLAHEYRLEATEPGYHVFRVDRALTQQLADEIQGLRAWCTEEYSPAVGLGVYGNGDSGTSNAAYSFTELRPTRAPDGSELPPPDAPAVTPTSESPEDEVSSYGAGSVLVLVAAAAALAVVGGRRRRQTR